MAGRPGLGEALNCVAKRQHIIDRQDDGTQSDARRDGNREPVDPGRGEHWDFVDLVGQTRRDLERFGITLMLRGRSFSEVDELNLRSSGGKVSVTNRPARRAARFVSPPTIIGTDRSTGWRRQYASSNCTSSP